MNKELENILLKVSELYNKYGIKSVTMDDVARELGMSKKTLYQYVENKNDLVSKVLEYHMDIKKCSFKDILSKELNAIDELLEVGVYIIKSLNDYNSSLLYDLKKYYPELSQKLHEIRKDRMYNSIINNIIKGKKEGLFRSEIDNEIIAKIQTRRFIYMSSGEFFEPQQMLNPKYIMELFIYHIRGIANSKGIDALEKKFDDVKKNTKTTAKKVETESKKIMT